MRGTNPIRVRRAVAADLPGLVEMVNDAYRMEEAFLEGQRINLDRMRGHFEAGTIFVAEDVATARVVACVYAEVLTGNAKNPCIEFSDKPSAGGTGYMGMLAVDPACQGSGLARRMMETAEGHLRDLGCGQVEISVLSLRPELMPIYNHLGFVPTGTGKYGFHRKLKPGVECETILMTKRI